MNSTYPFTIQDEYPTSYVCALAQNSMYVVIFSDTVRSKKLGSKTPANKFLLLTNYSFIMHSIKHINNNCFGRRKPSKYFVIIFIKRIENYNNIYIFFYSKQTTKIFNHLKNRYQNVLVTVKLSKSQMQFPSLISLYY